MNRIDYIKEMADYLRRDHEAFLKKEAECFIVEFLSYMKPAWIHDTYISFNLNIDYIKTDFFEYDRSIKYFILYRKYGHIVFKENVLNLNDMLKTIFLLKEDVSHIMMRPHFKRFLASLNYLPEKKLKFFNKPARNYNTY